MEYPRKYDIIFHLGLPQEYAYSYSPCRFNIHIASTNPIWLSQQALLRAPIHSSPLCANLLTQGSISSQSSWDSVCFQLRTPFLRVARLSFTSFLTQTCPLFWHRVHPCRVHPSRCPMCLRDSTWSLLQSKRQNS